MGVGGGCYRRAAHADAAGSRRFPAERRVASSLCSGRASASGHRSKKIVARSSARGLRRSLVAVDLLDQRPASGAALLRAGRRLPARERTARRPGSLPGVGLVTGGLFALVFGLVRGQAEGGGARSSSGASPRARSCWPPSSPGSGARRSLMLPSRPVRRARVRGSPTAWRSFMYFGTFGSIFLITQFVQQVMATRRSTRRADARLTARPRSASPIAGVLAESPRPARA